MDKAPIQAASAATRKSCFPPITNVHTRLLILGSLPGEFSLTVQQYYAHPRNQFWMLLSDLLSVDLFCKSYVDRLEQLQKYGIGLWDVVASAARIGSLDTAMRQKQYNNLFMLIEKLPNLQLIAFNGKTAAKAAPLLANTLPYLVLPSSSPAYTMSLEKKKTAWKQLQRFL